MQPKDYDFFVSGVNALGALLSGGPCMKEGLQSLQSDTVLFLLFNLERRVPLKDASILDLFQQLSFQCKWSFQLLVVKVHIRSVESPQSSLLLQQCRTDGDRSQTLQVYELLCRGTHDGWRFGDEEDMKALEKLVFDGRDLKSLLSSPSLSGLVKCQHCRYSCTWLSTYCCYRCAKTDGSQHGEKCDHLELVEWTSYTCSQSLPGRATLWASRATRFDALLSEAREAQRNCPKSLWLQTSAVRKLERSLFRELDECLANEHLEKFKTSKLMEKMLLLLGHPIYAAHNWMWCPSESDLPKALQILTDADVCRHEFNDIF